MLPGRRTPAPLLPTPAAPAHLLTATTSAMHRAATLLLVPAGWLVGSHPACIQCTDRLLHLLPACLRSAPVLPLLAGRHPQLHPRATATTHLIRRHPSSGSSGQRRAAALRWRLLPPRPWHPPRPPSRLWILLPAPCWSPPQRARQRRRPRCRRAPPRQLQVPSISCRAAASRATQTAAGRAGSLCRARAAAAALCRPPEARLCRCSGACSLGPTFPRLFPGFLVCQAWQVSPLHALAGWPPSQSGSQAASYASLPQTHGFLSGDAFDPWQCTYTAAGLSLSPPLVALEPPILTFLSTFVLTTIDCLLLTTISMPLDHFFCSNAQPALPCLSCFVLFNLCRHVALSSTTLSLLPPFLLHSTHAVILTDCIPPTTTMSSRNIHMHPGIAHVMHCYRLKIQGWLPGLADHCFALSPKQLPSRRWAALAATHISAISVQEYPPVAFLALIGT